jgi:hypothetical protein
MPPDSSPPTLPTGSIPPPSPAAMPDDPYDSLGPAELVTLTRTPQTGLELRVSLILGHHEATGAAITPARLRSAWSMLAVEHGGETGGHRIPGWAIWCNNSGNISRALKVHGAAWAGDYFDLTAKEDLPGGPRLVTQQLRAHSSAIEGAADYWSVLLGRFPEAVAAMDLGDLDGVAVALKATGYYTASASAYAAGLRAWARIFDERFS